MKKRILVVDDDEQILRTFMAILEKAGYLVDTANTVADAEKKLRQNRYDVALIDIKLPDAEGTELLLTVPKASDMVKIIVTGYSTVEYGEKSADYGADEFLVKPVKPKELLEVINRLISEA